MDVLNDLFAILSVLSAIYLALDLVCTLIEQLPAYSGARPRRGRTQRTHRRVRTTRPRRRRDAEKDQAAFSARGAH